MPFRITRAHPTIRYHTPSPDSPKNTQYLRVPGYHCVARAVAKVTLTAHISEKMVPSHHEMSP